MPSLSNHTDAALLCPSVVDACSSDQLSHAESNEVHKMMVAVRELRSCPGKFPTSDSATKDGGLVAQILAGSVRTIRSLLPSLLQASQISQSAQGASLTVRQNSNNAVEPDLATAEPSRLFGYFPDPLRFPQAAAMAYSAHSVRQEQISDEVRDDSAMCFYPVDGPEVSALLTQLDLQNERRTAAVTSLQDKELLLEFLPHKLDKRAPLNPPPLDMMAPSDDGLWQMRVADSAENCRIRTRTNAGTVVGDSLLVSGEYVRNPVRGALEQIKAVLLPDQPMTETEVTLAEIGNVGQDIVLGVFTAGAYPIVKYGAAKALNVAGNAVNGDMRCLRQEFSGEQMAQLLFDTEVGLTNRGLTSRTLPKELARATPLKPQGLFVHEHLGFGVQTEKYIRIRQHGQDILIREKSPGVFVTSHPHARYPERLEQRVFFDAPRKQVFFERNLPATGGYDVDIVDGRNFIRLHGQQHELRYNWQAKRPEIHVHTEGKSKVLPVYMEKISGRWHLSHRGRRPVFSSKESDLIERLRVADHQQYRYRAIDNLNPKAYGHGQIYEARQPDKFMTDAADLQVVELNGALVPVRLKVVPQHGVSYEVLDIAAPDRPGRLIEWEGSRWIFERPSSEHVARGLKSQVNRAHFDRSISVKELSAPDDRGVRWTKHNNAYLKIKNGFVRIYPSNAHPDLYLMREGQGFKRLVYKNEQFQVQTLAQRLYQLRTTGLSGRGAGQAAQRSAGQKRSAAEIVASAYYTDLEGARRILDGYRFPSSGTYDQVEFALWVERYQTVPPWAKRFRLENLQTRAVNDPRIQMGEVINDGADGVVFNDAATPGYVIKEFKSKLRTNDLKRRLKLANSERAMFNKYYGPGAAAVIRANNSVYLRMYKVPGQALSEIPVGILPHDACERYVDMVERMLDQGIMHGDLHVENFMYDVSTQQFHPIDLSNQKSRYFNALPARKNAMNLIDQKWWDESFAKIRSLKAESPEELAILGNVPFTDVERNLVGAGLWLDDIVRIRTIGGLKPFEVSAIERGASLETVLGLRAGPST